MNSEGTPGAVRKSPFATRLRLRAYQERGFVESESAKRSGVSLLGLRMP
jgi:hypothetical protein